MTKLEEFDTSLNADLGAGCRHNDHRVVPVSKYVSQTYNSIRRASVPVVVLLDHDAIGRGSNPAVDVHSGKNIRSGPRKIGTTRVPFVRPFQTLNTTQNSLYMYFVSSLTHY